MTQAKPTEIPRWASNPTDPGDTIVAPTSLQLDEGWQPEGSAAYPDGYPDRQHFNWWQNRVWQCIQWLLQSGFNPADIFADQGIPGTGSLPTTGAGLSVTAGNFSSSAFVSGARIDAVSAPSPAATYGASKDAYWDLANSGTWTKTEVANGAGAPAVAANSVRIFKVVTDGTGRTSAADLRPTFLGVGKALKLGVGMTTNAAPPLSFARQDATVRYTLISEDATDTIKTREYWSGDAFATPGSVVRIRTHNAWWDQGTLQWKRDDNTADSYMEVVGGGFQLYGRKATDADAWSESQWTILSYHRIDTSSAYLQHARDGNGVFQWGFTAARTIAKTISAASVTFYTTADPEFDVFVPSYGGRFQWGASTPADALFPIEIPNGATITKIEVLLNSTHANACWIRVERDDLSNSDADTCVAALRSSGTYNPGVVNSVDRTWVEIPGLDGGTDAANLTVDNLSYRYHVRTTHVGGNGVLHVYAVRVTYSHLFMTNQ